MQLKQNGWPLLLLFLFCWSTAGISLQWTIYWSIWIWDAHSADWCLYTKIIRILFFLCSAAALSHIIIAQWCECIIFTHTERERGREKKHFLCIKIYRISGPYSKVDSRRNFVYLVNEHYELCFQHICWYNFLEITQ